MQVTLEINPKNSWQWRVKLDTEAANVLRRKDRVLLGKCGKWTNIDDARTIKKQVEEKLGLIGQSL